MHVRRTAALLATAALAAALAGCASASPGAESASTTIQFGLPTNMGANNSPMAVAEAMGYFADEGLKVEIVVTGDSTSIV